MILRMITSLMSQRIWLCLVLVIGFALTGVPTAPRAHKAFTVTISVTRDKQPQAGKAPTVRLLSSSISVINITARETEQLGVYKARIVFPSAGMWRITVIDRMTGRAYPFGRLRVRTA